MKNLVFVGTYSRPDGSRGIYRFQQNPATGELHADGLALEMANSSFLALLPKLGRAYAVGELSDYEGKPQGAVHAMKMDPATGALAELNRQPSLGRSPCHICVLPDGKRVIVANYGGGNVTLFRTDSDGMLEPACCNIQHEGKGPHPKRQERAHTHSVTLSPDERFVIVADLGLDLWCVYRLEGDNLVRHSELSSAPGAGPRHFAFHPDGQHAFGINELGSTLTAFNWDAQAGVLSEINTVGLLPDGFSGESTAADIHVSPDGAFVYGSNRGHDSIVTCRIDPKTFAVSIRQRTPCGGMHPRNFALPPDGRFLYVANMNTHNIACFRIDHGLLTPTGMSTAIGMPVCIKFLTSFGT